MNMMLIKMMINMVVLSLRNIEQYKMEAEVMNVMLIVMIVNMMLIVMMINTMAMMMMIMMENL